MASAVTNVAAEEAKEAEDIRKVLKSTRLVQSWPELEPNIDESVQEKSSSWVAIAVALLVPARAAGNVAVAFKNVVLTDISDANTNQAQVAANVDYTISQAIVFWIEFAVLVFLLLLSAIWLIRCLCVKPGTRRAVRGALLFRFMAFLSNVASFSTFKFIPSTTTTMRRFGMVHDAKTRYGLGACTVIIAYLAIIFMNFFGFWSIIIKIRYQAAFVVSTFIIDWTIWQWLTILSLINNLTSVISVGDIELASAFNFATRGADAELQKHEMQVQTTIMNWQMCHAHTNFGLWRTMVWFYNCKGAAMERMFKVHVPGSSRNLQLSQRRTSASASASASATIVGPAPHQYDGSAASPNGAGSAAAQAAV